MELKVSAIEFSKSLDDTKFASADLDPGDMTFQRIDTELGSFVVMIKDVQPFADGVKVTVSFGNPSAAQFNGVEVKLRYGARKPPFSWGEGSLEKMKSWSESLQSKDMTLTEPLLPGNWNSIAIPLPNIKQDEFGYLEVKLSTNKVSLR